MCNFCNTCKKILKKWNEKCFNAVECSCAVSVSCLNSVQSYSMRNGILGLMGEIVVKVLCKEDLDDAAKKLRDQLLDKMEVSVISCNELT